MRYTSRSILLSLASAFLFDLLFALFKRPFGPYDIFFFVALILGFTILWRLFGNAIGNALSAISIHFNNYQRRITLQKLRTARDIYQNFRRTAIRSFQLFVIALAYCVVTVVFILATLWLSRHVPNVDPKLSIFAADTTFFIFMSITAFLLFKTIERFSSLLWTLNTYLYFDRRCDKLLNKLALLRRQVKKDRFPSRRSKRQAN